MKVKESALAYKTEKKVYTYEDWVKLPEDSWGYEIINGELTKSPSPMTNHQRVVANIAFELQVYLRSTQQGELIFAPMDVVLSNTNIFQPDILFISNENSDIITEKNIQGAPDLIAEVLSPSTTYKDLFDKKELYEQFGVKEYWIIDPKREWVEVYTLNKSKYSLLQKIEKEGVITSKIFPELKLFLNAIFVNK
jgi:Uma2 family endonuclease